MSAPLISVVTPCLNAVATIEQTLRSVREQGLLEGTVEHVVVDGGSTDGTVELLEQVDGVTFTSEPDRGLSDAMNKGIAAARGKLVGWLNADDYYLPGALARVRATLEDEPEALWITGPVRIVDGADVEIRPRVTAYKRWLLRHYSHRSLLVQNFVAAPGTFVRREALLELGGFDERFSYSMDYDVWLKLAGRRPPIVIDEPLAAFRMAGESLSMTGFETQFAEHARNAREHGAGHPVAVAVNQLVSRGIVLTYRAIRAWPGRR